MKTYRTTFANRMIQPHVFTLDIEAIATAMRKAKPDLTPGTFNAAQTPTMKGQMIGWRYSVLMLADSLQRAHGPAFNRDEFNKQCGV